MNAVGAMSWPELRLEIARRLPRGVPLPIETVLEAMADTVDKNFVYEEIAPGQKRVMNRVINLLIGVAQSRQRQRELVQASQEES